ncbi:MAG: hypothetical protein BGO31_00760 [Bacteroidetes bacterium 43-16]|nr:MAG: hypothetical protein BGO31_00760 [Bacteroidetes bacterium 43-16]
MRSNYKFPSLIIILFTLLSFTASSQDYPFARGFSKGIIFLNDSSQLSGQLKWFPNQYEKLQFRLKEGGDIKKYAPGEIMGFTADGLKFEALFDLEVYAENYALLGKTSRVKHTFGEVLSSGPVAIYYVLVTGYNAVSGVVEIYPNIYFQKKVNDKYVYAHYPVGIRMKDKKYEKAKENLYVFFNDYPEIVQQIKAYKKQDDFFKIIESIHKTNTTN